MYTLFHLAPRWYFEYAVVQYQQSYIYFGGAGIDEKSIIAKFDLQTSQWSKMGKLEAGRQSHNAIFDGSYFLIVRGYRGRYKTEKCSVSNSTMTCQEQQPELYKYQRFIRDLFRAENRPGVVLCSGDKKNQLLRSIIRIEFIRIEFSIVDLVGIAEKMIKNHVGQEKSEKSVGYIKTP